MKLRIITFILFYILFCLTSVSVNAQTKKTTQDSTWTRGKLDFLKKLVLFLDREHRSNRKHLKNFQRTGSVIYLERYLKTPEVKQRQHALNPLAYYMILGIVQEEKSDVEKRSCIYYNVAFKLDNDRKRTSRDIDLMNRIEALDKKHKQLTLHKEKNYNRWLASKMEKCHSHYDYGIGKEKNVIDSLEQQIVNIEEEIRIEQDTIRKITNDINRRKIERVDEEEKIKRAERQIEKVKSNQHYQNAIIAINDIEDMRQQDLDKIQQELNNINNGNTAVNSNLEDVSSMNLGLKVVENEEDGISIDAKGQVIGKYCTQNTQNATKMLVNLILNKVYNIPFHDKENLSINLNITGHADWRGSGGGLLDIIYEASQDMKENYNNRDNETQSFFLSQGQKKRISNEELAFLRAYCAYITAYEILEEQNLKIDKLIFKAMEHLEKDGTDGKAFRGVDLQIQIDGLDKYYERLIAEEEEKIKLSKLRIIEIKEKITTYELNVKRIKKRIKMKNGKIDEILLKIEQAEDRIISLRNVQKRYSTKDGDRSQANHIIETIEVDRKKYDSKKKKP
ncbi:MAG: hypothetical protein ACPG5B_13930 [Chitinophagales bacterium]